MARDDVLVQGLRGLENTATACPDVRAAAATDMILQPCPGFPPLVAEGALEVLQHLPLPILQTEEGQLEILKTLVLPLRPGMVRRTWVSLLLGNM